MKKIITLLLIIACLSSFGQVVTTKIVKVANNTTTFNENLIKDIEILDITTKRIYLTLRAIASTKSISTCTIDVDLKELSSGGTTPVDNVLHWNGTAYTPDHGKRSVNPGYAYFYNSAIYGDNPYCPTCPQLLLNGKLMATSLSTPNMDGYLYTTMDSTGLTTSGYNANLKISMGNEQWGTPSLYRNYALIYTNDGYSHTKPILIGDIGINHSENIVIDDSARIFKINMTNINLSKGTANKWLSLDANKNVVYNNAPSSGVTPIDNILHWDGTAYSPFTAKKGTDPGYAYFYNAYSDPTSWRSLRLDGNMYATGFVTPNGTSYSQINYNQVLNSRYEGTHLREAAIDAFAGCYSNLWEDSNNFYVTGIGRPSNGTFPYTSEIYAYRWTQSTSTRVDVPLKISASEINTTANITMGEILKLTPRSSAPSSPSLGWVYVNTDTHIYMYNGTTWKQLDN